MMSVRQFQMLELVANGGFSIKKALELNQLTFGSLCYQHWVEYDQKRQLFLLSDDGKAAFNFARYINHFRKVNTFQFSSRVKLRKGISIVRPARAASARHHARAAA
jgi:hypothetical protein